MVTFPHQEYFCMEAIQTLCQCPPGPHDDNLSILLVQNRHDKLLASGLSGYVSPFYIVGLVCPPPAQQEPTSHAF